MNYLSIIFETFPLIFLLFCGFYITFKGKFFQFTNFFNSIKLTIEAFKTPKDKNKFSSFQAACTSLSAAVGTGNIAGVAGAISLGGAGAVFWMWISALLGMAIKSAEIVLATNFREKHKGEFLGGPMYYIKNGLPKKFSYLATCFSLACIPAVFSTGNITQTNAAVCSITNTFSIKLFLGLLFSALCFIVIFGGITKIGRFTEKIVPLMSVIYIILCLIVIIFNIDFLPKAFKMIIVGAFNPKAVTGGAVGTFLSSAVIGCERGVFSNESGLGTAGMSHSAAYDANADTQGLFGIFEVFVDTILLCTLTAVTILCGNTPIPYGKDSSSELVVNALSGVLGNFAHYIIAIMLCLFAFSSIIGWAVYGSICAKFLFGEKGAKIFMLIYPIGCIIGAVSPVHFAWKTSAIFNSIMLIINLPVIILLWDKAEIHIKKRKKDVKKQS